MNCKRIQNACIKILSILLFDSNFQVPKIYVNSDLKACAIHYKFPLCVWCRVLQIVPIFDIIKYIIFMKKIYFFLIRLFLFVSILGHLLVLHRIWVSHEWIKDNEYSVFYSFVRMFKLNNVK